MQRGETALDCTAMEDIYHKGISRMRYLLPFPLIITALLTSVTALAADDTFELSTNSHRRS
jgi:hypothetical protein